MNEKKAKVGKYGSIMFSKKTNDNKDIGPICRHQKGRLRMNN